VAGLGWPVDANMPRAAGNGAAQTGRAAALGDRHSCARAGSAP